MVSLKAALFGAVAASGIAYLYMTYLRFEEIECDMDREILFLSYALTQKDFLTAHVNLCDVYSDDYFQARSRFVDALDLLDDNDQIEMYEHHAIPITSDHNGQNLTIDVAVIHGSEANSGLVVHTSGVHGVEGYAGSAIQISLIKALAATKWSSDVDLPTIILVHAVNPFGMARFRRFNENNVDLNRNGLDPQTFQEFAANYFNHDNYNQFDSHFNHKYAPNWFTASIGFWLRAAVPIIQHGVPKLKEAMVNGQFHNPRGIFYGGSQLEASVVELNDFMKDYLEQNDFHSPVTWIDVHTGLGKFGSDVLLFDESKDSITHVDHKRKLREEVFRWFTDSETSVNLHSEAARVVTQGYQNISTLTEYFHKLFREGNNALSFSQEFGTLPPPLVGRALVLESAANNNLPPDEALLWAKRLLRPAFYPNHPYWRKRVLQNGIKVAAQAIQRSALRVF